MCVLIPLYFKAINVFGPMTMKKFTSLSSPELFTCRKGKPQFYNILHHEMSYNECQIWIQET